MNREVAHAHITAQERLRRAVSQAVAHVWATLPAYDDGNVDEFLGMVVPVVNAGQRQSVAVTEAYLARERRRRPLGIDPGTVIGPAARNGVAPEEVYRRPFVTVWTALKAGTAFAQAVDAGLERLTSTAETDIQLAMRGTLQAVGEADDGIHGYERIPDGNACDLCLIASTQRYHVSDLMPIHNRCGCGVGVLTDPAVGQVINQDRYRQLKDSGAIKRITGQRQRSRGAAAEQVTVAVRDHGELGPVLVDAAQHFTQL